MTARLRVRLTPRAARDRLTGWRDGLLTARVAAAPVDGAANAALLALVARALGVPRSRVRLRSGASSREKTLEVEGLDQEAVAARLAALLPGDST